MAEDPDIETSLLVIIFDAHPSQAIYREQSQILTQCLDSVIIFANSHLMLKTTNKLAVLSCCLKTTKFLYPTASDNDQGTLRQIDGQYEVFTHVEKTLRENLRSLVLSDEDSASEANKPSDTLIAGALARALCYIHRFEREHTLSKNNSRVLIVTGSRDSATQYMPYMNCFFTAQKQNIMVDVCSLGEDLNLLKQGCDITGGIYLKVPQFNSLVQYLLWVFLPEPTIRNKLLLPPPVKVDYRAACFCHRELVSIGYVCSVCLSVFCKFSPICTTCHTVFKKPGPLPMKPKKRKLVKLK